MVNSLVNNEMFTGVFQIYDLSYCSSSNCVARALSLYPADRWRERGRTGTWGDQPKVVQVGAIFSCQTRRMRVCGEWPLAHVMSRYEFLFPLSVNLSVADIIAREEVRMLMLTLLTASRLTPASWLLETTISSTSNSQGILWSNADILRPKWPSWVRAKVDCWIRCSPSFSSFLFFFSSSFLLSSVKHQCCPPKLLSCPFE